MKKRICWSVLLGIVIYILTMMVCNVVMSQPDMFSPIAIYYSGIIVGVAFFSYGLGETKKRNKLVNAMLLAIAVFSFTMLMGVFLTPFQEFVLNLAIYYTAISFIVACIAGILGEGNQKNK